VTGPGALLITATVDSMMARLKESRNPTGDQSGNVVVELTRAVVQSGRTGGRGYSGQKKTDLMAMFGPCGVRVDFMAKTEPTAPEEEPEEPAEKKLRAKVSRDAKTLRALAKHLLS
jgi:hypothetical protein